jgi:hypothetical protein
VRINRSRRKKAVIGLTDAEELDLLLGGPPAFPSDAARREAWVKHRDALIAALAPERPHAQCVFEGYPTPEEELAIRLAPWKEEADGK